MTQVCETSLLKFRSDGVQRPKTDFEKPRLPVWRRFQRCFAAVGRETGLRRVRASSRLERIPVAYIGARGRESTSSHFSGYPTQSGVGSVLLHGTLVTRYLRFSS